MTPPASDSSGAGTDKEIRVRPRRRTPAVSDTDGTWHYLTPDENAVTIGAPAEDLAELDNFLRRSGSVLGPGAIEIADALVSRGVLAVPGQVPEIPRPQRVLMDGIGPVADACIALLSKALPHLEVVSTTAPIEDGRCVVGPRTVGCRCSSSRRVVGTRDLVPPKPNTVATRPRGAGRDLHRTLLRRYRQRKLPGRLRSTACRVARPGSSAGTVESPRRQRTSPART